MKFKMFIVAVSIGLFAAVAGAQDKAPNRELLAKLEQMRSESESKAQTLTGGPKMKWLLQEARINKFIERIKAGQTVDPKEIDQLLREQSR